jgi:formylglycine-generating enzyme required for sulfatase activity
MTQHSRTSTTIGRSDLVAAIATGQPNTIAAAVSMLGLERTAATPLPDPKPHPIPLPPDPKTKATLQIDSSGYPRDIEAITLWHCIAYRQFAPLGKPDLDNARHEWRVEDGATAATHQLLADWNEIAPRLRRCLSDVRFSQHPDVPKLVAKVARRELIVEIPRQTRRHWGAEVHLVTDTSVRLTAFAPDHEEVIRRIRGILPQAKVHVAQGATPSALWYRADDRPFADAAQRRFTTPPAGSTILVLGDLGCLSRDPNFWRQWFHWGQDQQRSGNQLMALVPCGAKRIATPLNDVFSVESWQSGKLAVDDPVLREDLVEQLLVLAAPAIRLEPGLLRDLRFLLPAASDASLEVDVWNSPMLAGTHPDAATIDRDIARKQLLPKFERLPETLRRNALTCLRRWRLKFRQDPELWFAELLCLSRESRRLIPAQDLKDARASTRHLSLERKSDSARGGRVKVWMFNETDWLTDDAFQDEEVGPLLRQTRRELHDEPNAVLAGTDLRELPTGPLCRYRIDLDDQRLTVTKPETSGPANTVVAPAAWLHGSVSQIEVASAGPLRGDAFWKTGKPDFVSDYGTDQYGAWFEFSVPRANGQGVVTQKMRWIPAGKFLMGSPDDEPERWSDEGPQHEVTLSRGFWLAETACSQELWEAVTGQNPSRFKGALRPVEQVSYNDVTGFVEKLNGVLHNLSREGEAPAEPRGTSDIPHPFGSAGASPSRLPFSLPTEAQWEYACRAGATTPFSFGETVTTDQANFNGDHPYAGSPKGENRQQTVDVKALPANPWGLFQMHGNVWEWCADWNGEYSAEPQADPTGPERGSYRVVRGGGWFSRARLVRSACRFWYAPGDRHYYLGFRLLSSVLAEPTEAAAVPVAEQGPQPTRFGGADEIFSGHSIRVDEQTPAQIEVHGPGPIRVRSNLEEIHLQRVTKPRWAVAYGRDPFGIYADFQVPAADSPPVRQRMRWIPPGQFQMGSPDTEPGRYDNETRHAVTLSAGFWMFDSPVPQRLWQAIRPGENPSFFPDPDRPVETVRWQDAVDFAKELGERLTDQHGERVELHFTLPTEAQWEYACRAGTSTAIYTGPLEILGDGNAPALDPIAWYGGNCGHEYDLEKGQPVTWLTNKQYEFAQGGTRRVKEKIPNPWGLYDMLGNVWEWCRDWHADYPSGSQVDPMGPESGSSRVIRGGSWFSYARGVRSACRHWRDPGDRLDYLGFRLLSSASPAQFDPPNK